ncbi:uncharacterized protein UV8b_07024 [Ustilaginoidea virens]|uniref:Uncharacterized protein n=1 Tax=Ustilaginoidea virens TaxID=1159556 RepID=A0A8E5HWE7_USTVR|nr:uncharacterized protein UV8b_07024 [Ustilaginoidea virens]QUC22783.1 hypothetical protein UV8b_07024 [Ustilaginoidea virens]
MIATACTGAYFYGIVRIDHAASPHSRYCQALRAQVRSKNSHRPCMPFPTLLAKRSDGVRLPSGPAAESRICNPPAVAGDVVIFVVDVWSAKSELDTPL